MHNCKTTRNSFIDLVFDEIPPASSRQLLAELSACPDCREEYAAVRSTLHVSARALRSNSPDESFWPGYNERLRHALVATADAHAVAQPAGTSNGLWPALKRILTTSVRIPVPAAAALMLLFVISVVGMRSRGEVNAIPPTPIAAVETRTVMVPVVEEKVITRVVYVPDKTRRTVRRGLDHSRPATLDNSLASSTSAGSDRNALNLVGFEPTDKVRLTVIKGSYRNEK